MTSLTLPEAEAVLVAKHYSAASVILEYGSGGSTRLAAQLNGKLVVSVESDRDWAITLQKELDVEKLPSPAIVYHVDIGETGAWGRPIDDSHWQQYYRYPTAVWEEAFFRHPDVVLIDGRFRLACFATLCLRISKHVTVLFDDYVNRPRYQVVGDLIPPTEIVGRMARFDLHPDCVSKEMIPRLIGMFFNVTYAADHVDYS